MLVEALLAAGEIVEARAALIEAHARLMDRASAIDRAEWRAAFLARLPDHARTLELYRQYAMPT